MSARKSLTLSDVGQRVNEIKEVSGDDEIAHSLEDALRRDVLSWAAINSVDATVRAIAAEALKTEQIEFERWCA